jgi:hypothetical protein
MMNDYIVSVICATIIAISGILGIVIYNLEENKLKNQNIEQAITKGIDPLSVRCSYANAQDMVCVAHAASKR